MKKNQEQNQNHFATLSQDELVELVNLEQRFGYTLIAYKQEPPASQDVEKSSLK